MVFGFWYGIHSEVFSFFGAGGGGGRPVVILSREKENSSVNRPLLRPALGKKGSSPRGKKNGAAGHHRSFSRVCHGIVLPKQ